jgi:hypothetical protein
MCVSILIDGEEFDTFGEVSKKLNVPMIRFEGHLFEPKETDCLCSADIPKMAEKAGMNCHLSMDFDNHPLISYIVESKKG